MTSPLAAVILAGGRARRLAGADKPGLVIGDRTVLASVVHAAGMAGARPVIVVGPPRPGLGLSVASVRFTSEQPPGAGPVPALRAGLRLVAEPWLLLLAADLPFLQAEHLRELRHVADGSGAAVLVDDTGAPQWLASCWRTADVRAALDRYCGDSLRGVLAPLRPAPAAIAAGSGPPPWLDCDTADDVATARKWVGERRPDEQHAG